MRIRLEFKIEDFWIGVFWQRRDPYGTLNVWVCFLPCVPIHIIFPRSAWRT